MILNQSVHHFGETGKRIIAMDYTVLIAEDHPLFRNALSAAVHKVFTNVTIIESDSIPTLQHTLESHSPPNLILLDLHMPGAHGFSALLFLKNHYPSIPILVISAREQEKIILQAIAYGAAGFIPKSSPADAIFKAIPSVLSGNQWVPEHIDLAAASITKKSDMEEKIATLTPQQFRVLGMVSEGLLNKQIAFDLDVSEATIKAHVTAIFKKLKIKNRTQAVLALQQLELDDPLASPPGEKNDASISHSENHSHPKQNNLPGT